MDGISRGGNAEKMTFDRVLPPLGISWMVYQLKFEYGINKQRRVSYNLD